MKKFVGLFVLLALVACSGDDKPVPAQDAPAPEPQIRTDNLICPQVAILRESDEVFDYGGENPDPAQLVAKARLKNIDGDCAYRKDEGKDTGIDIAFTLHAVAARGPRLGENQIGFPYFIAVVNSADSVLSRQIVTAQFKFSGSDKVTETNEPLHVFIPLPVEDLPLGPDYRVLIGFTKSTR